MNSKLLENDDMYFYRTYYLLEAIFIVEKRNEEREKYGKEVVDIDSKLSHDMLDKYVHAKCHQLSHNRAMGAVLI